ncbi:MAG: hypothetical protein M1829_004394 [Trizodia sp. TS-e1964]|nr:MAG: hypothetical protein M1829_004394 [Trizodia sp. TS-e1964]
MSNGLRLLSLDGGGVRGLSALMVLEQLMHTINPENPPKPCDYFDMIGGTSTGGLIAIMLGRLRMSVSDCIDAYLKLSDRIFQKKNHRVTIKGKVQGRFDSEELTRAIKEVLKAENLEEDALLKDESENACKVFVCATSKQTSEVVRLTSYRSRGSVDLLNTVKIWEACRATSAASSFFDSISIGKYGEEFVDGATGANNPVWQLWNEAQLVWGPQPLDSRIRCLVSIGTGVPSLTPVKDDVLHIHEMLIAMATETEQTAEMFRRDKALLDNSGRYYRFNVERGLEEIGLEQSKKRNEIAAATRRYYNSQSIINQMNACARNATVKEYFGGYQIAFSLEGVPKTYNYVARPNEIAKIEQELLPHGQSLRQKIFVLYGLGGIGKTQLCIEFAQQHWRKFSAVFWLDGSSEDNLKRSIAKSASRIPEGQISQFSRTYSTDGANSSADIDIVVEEVMRWLAQENNTDWLLTFDNIDREFSPGNDDPDSYDVKCYFSSATHGSILITTRLEKLRQLGNSHCLGKVNPDQAIEIFKNRYQGEEQYSAERDSLLEKLDGLPLAIAQAAAYLHETNIGIKTYLRFYEEQWKKIMNSQDDPLPDYNKYRSVWTTWAISYNAIKKKHLYTANLLDLWAFLDNKDLWFGLFANVYGYSEEAEKRLYEQIGDLASDECEFSDAMRLLRSYSLIESVKDIASYTTHPVVHKWVYTSQPVESREQLAQLALIVIYRAIPEMLAAEYFSITRRLLPHAQACCRLLPANQKEKPSPSDKEESFQLDGVKAPLMLDVYSCIAEMYRNQGKLSEAEKMYQRALQGYEEAVGPKHTSTLNTVNNLGTLFSEQGKLSEAEKMYQRALQGYEEAVGPKHTSTLDTVHNLGNLLAGQGKLSEAEKMYQRALQGCEEALGLKHTSTLSTVHNLGTLFSEQGKLSEAEKMYQRALQGREEALGLKHTSTLSTVGNLGTLFFNQGKLSEAEKMYQRALQGCEEALGPKHTSTLITVHNLGLLLADQGKLSEAEKMYQRALQGYEEALGPKHTSTLITVNNLGTLFKNQGKLSEAEKMYQRALQGYEEARGPEGVKTYRPALNSMWNLGSLAMIQGNTIKAREMYSAALAGFEKIYGSEHTECQRLRELLSGLDSSEEIKQGHASTSKRVRLLKKLGLR